MFIAMTLPEWMLFTAFNEWMSVRRLRNCLNELAKTHKAKVSLKIVRISLSDFS